MFLNALRPTRDENWSKLLCPSMWINSLPYFSQTQNSFWIFTPQGELQVSTKTLFVSFSLLLFSEKNKAFKAHLCSFYSMITLRCLIVGNFLKVRKNSFENSFCSLSNNINCNFEFKNFDNI